MKAMWMGILAAIPVSIAVACSPGPKSSSGFRLPDGEVGAGRLAFEALKCIDCHTVAGTELAPPENPRTVEVHLGGKVLRVRTYGELVTAIIHPSFEIAGGAGAEAVAEGGDSIMRDVNDTMTVKQLIDLVAFLQSTYTEYLPKDYDPHFP